jgi:hypothetical protein
VSLEELDMTLTDEEYKPLQVLAHYDTADTQENKMIFSLAQLGEGTVPGNMPALFLLYDNAIGWKKLR